MFSYIRTLLVCAVFAAPLLPLPASASPLLLQNPTVSRTQIAFVYGGDIWVVGREGGQARRLITGYGLASAPYFSPDGSTIAFSANYDGRVNTYVVAASGGQPKRLTFHPSPDMVVGWTRDGSRVLFRSRRNSATDANQLYTIPASGGLATVIPLPDAQSGSYSPDGTHLAYVPNGQWEPYWRQYRGGQVTPIWIANLADSSVKRILTGNANYLNPMWIGNSIYYLSDRDGSFSLYAYDTTTGNSTRLVDNRRGFDIVSASANDGTIVYSKFDSIHLYDPTSHSDRQVPITIADEMPAVRPHWMKVAKEINGAQISPTGVRAVFEAHGEILTVPTEHGDIRNLTQTPGAAERDPAWSPNGKWIAYFSDATGEYTLRIKDQKGQHPARMVVLAPNPSYYYSPTWSPDSKKIAYLDKHLGMYYVDVSEERPSAVKFAEQRYENLGPTFDAQWSPDSRYITYTVTQPNFLRAVYVYDTKEGRAYQITDGMSDSSSPVFDKSGKYLYFLSSTNTGFTPTGLDMEADERATTASVYAVVLDKSLNSPVAPQSDEEASSSDEPEAAPAKPAASASPKASAKPVAPGIDFENIGQRIVALPIPEANYVSLQASIRGRIILGAQPLTTVTATPPLMSIYAFDTTSRHVLPLATKVEGFIVSFDGKKMLLQKPGEDGADDWSIVSTMEPVKPGDGDLDTASLEVYSVPHEEWAQMYRETWRIERDYFYDPNYHGLDIARAQQLFAQFLPGLASRDDFTYLTERMIGYLEVGHLWVGGPEPTVDKVDVGMLGADYSVSDGRFRFSKIYSGENWNPKMQAPLTQPGVDVHAGDYLLAVNGQPVRPDREVYAAFEETAGKQTTITVGPNPNGTLSHDVTVVPVASERNLRYREWIDGNRRYVDRVSGGRIGYLHLPDTEYGGFTNFNRYYFAQVGKAGIVLDERYNHGGQIADYIIDVLSRPTRAVIKARDGKSYTDPPLAITGPKVMLINQYAGSGGDALPWLFKKADLGPLVGVRTWGGLVGIGGYPTLMDGGDVMAPRIAIGGLHGQWEVEGHGVSPDVEVQVDPAQWRDGVDNQLETAVEVALKLLREHPIPNYQVPSYPNHNPQLPP